jgi:hypothetical protein
MKKKKEKISGVWGTDQREKRKKKKKGRIN